VLPERYISCGEWDSSEDLYHMDTTYSMNFAMLSIIAGDCFRLEMETDNCIQEFMDVLYELGTLVLVA
jgi:hypothetical protein